VSVEALADRLGVAERQALADGLSEHTLHELVQVLLGCENPQAVTQIASEVLEAIPSLEAGVPAFGPLRWWRPRRL
jgi:hypothetical protein